MITWQISTASKIQLVDGTKWSLASRTQLLTAPKPNSLSMFGNTGTTSQETRRVPSGKGPSLLSSCILFSRAVVSLTKDGCFLAKGCKWHSVKADRFAIAVPQHDVISLSGLHSLCVLIFQTLPRVLPYLFTTQEAIAGEISLFWSHFAHHRSTKPRCLVVGSACKLL